MAFWDTWFSIPAQISPKTQAITQTPEFQAAWPGYTPDYKTSTAFPGLASPAVTTTPSIEYPSTYSTGGYDFAYNPYSTTGWSTLGQTPTMESGAMTEYQRAMIDLQLQQLQKETGMSAEELALRRQELEAQTAYQNAQLAWQKEQWGQQLAQQQKDYLANLAAEPHSWLEYAAAAGQPPVIQPWMLPLMPQDYGFSAGQQIPGWSAENMTGMPSLINPSAQYMARMGPTAQQQYYGYEQGLTGARPEESAWRLWNMAPPSGNRGLVQVR